MKDGNYAVPDEKTTEEDKELLADIISEGSSEMKILILKCWKNNLKIAGPCSGIKEYHPNASMHRVHFGFVGPQEIMSALNEQFKDYFNVLLREKKLDVDKVLNEAITKEESDIIFRKMNELFDEALSNYLVENNSKSLE